MLGAQTLWAELRACTVREMYLLRLRTITATEKMLDIVSSKALRVHSVKKETSKHQWQHDLFCIEHNKLLPGWLFYSAVLESHAVIYTFAKWVANVPVLIWYSVYTRLIGIISYSFIKCTIQGPWQYSTYKKKRSEFNRKDYIVITVKRTPQTIRSETSKTNKK